MRVEHGKISDFHRRPGWLACQSPQACQRRTNGAGFHRNHRSLGNVSYPGSHPDGSSAPCSAGSRCGQEKWYASSSWAHRPRLTARANGQPHRRASRHGRGCHRARGRQGGALRVAARPRTSLTAAARPTLRIGMTFFEGGCPSRARRFRAMAIREVHVRSFSVLIRKLEGLALGGDGDFYVFRGHRDSAWRLTSTLARYATVSPDFRPMAVEYLTSRFVHGLASIGNREMIGMDRRAKLEFARHHGVPSPLIDVTRSPYIALWFAFNGVRGSVDGGAAAVYAINWNILGVAFSELARVMDWNEHLKRTYGMPAMDVFRWEIRDFFENGYPQPALKFIPYACSANTKIQRQMGCFIYDTLNYEELGVRDLEAFIGEHQSAVRVSRQEPILTKFIIRCSFAREVFNYLDVIGINGARLMDDYTGVAADVRNTFNHDPRDRAWDIKGSLEE